MGSIEVEYMLQTLSKMTHSIGLHDVNANCARMAGGDLSIRFNPVGISTRTMDDNSAQSINTIALCGTPPS